MHQELSQAVWKHFPVPDLAPDNCVSFKMATTQQGYLSLNLWFDVTAPCVWLLLILRIFICALNPVIEGDGERHAAIEQDLAHILQIRGCQKASQVQFFHQFRYKRLIVLPDIPLGKNVSVSQVTHPHLLKLLQDQAIYTGQLQN